MKRTSYLDPFRKREVPLADWDASLGLLKALPESFDEVMIQPAWALEPDEENPGEYHQGAYDGIRVGFERGGYCTEILLFHPSLMLKSEGVVERMAQIADAALKEVGV